MCPTTEDDRKVLAARLLAAAGRIERAVYVRPVTMQEAAFRLQWSDALITLAERLLRDPRAKES